MREFKHILFFSIFIFSTVLQAQTNTVPGHFYYEDEKQEDAYLPISIEDRITTAPYFFQNDNITTVQVNVDAQGLNLLNDAANEPSLAIDPTDPNRMVIGWRQFANIASNFRQAGLGISTDGGQSWDNRVPIEDEFFRSDPVLDTDINGNFYYNSLNTDYVCHVFKSTDLENWDEKVDANGGDKQWMVIDKTNQPSQGNIYAFWKAQFSACTEGSFTRSVDGGLSYEACSVVDDNPTRGTLALNDQGDLYACGGWYDTFKVLKSTSAKDPASAVNWDVNTEVDLKGTLALYAGPNPGGMLGQVWIATDQSEEITNGNVYLLSTVQRSDNGDPADIMFSRSLDGGNTWEEAIKINDDFGPDNWNWFGTLSVAPNGRIDVVWLDNRELPDTYLSALYYAYSLDGGETWSPNEKISEAFDPHLGWPSQPKIGDYYHMISYDEGAHLAWSATFNGEQDIYYSFIPAPVINVGVKTLTTASLIDMKIAPNPVQDQTQIRFKVKESAVLKFQIVDLLGKTAETIAQEFYQKGTHQLNWEPASNLTAGLYLLNISSAEGILISKKIIIE